MTLRADAPASKTARALDVGGGILGAGLLVGAAAWVVATCLQQDFAAYYTAARARAQGLDPYVNHLTAAGGLWDGIGVYQHSRFLYAPLVAELFRPLAALPFPVAKALFTGASLLALGGALHMVSRDTRPAPARQGRQRPYLGIMVLVAAVWPPIFLTLERGQIDLLLLPLLAAAWRWRERPWLGGVCLARCALAKPPGLAVLPLLVLAGGRRGALLTVAVIAFVVLFLGAGALVSGPQSSRRYLTEVLPRAATYGEGGPEAWLLPSDRLTQVAGDLADGTARIDGRGRAYAQELGTLRRSASLARLLSGDDGPSTALSLGIVAALGGVLTTVARRGRDSAGWFWGMLAVGILAAPVSWAMSLTCTLPLFFAFPARPTRENRPLSLALVTMFAAGFLGLAMPVGWALLGLAAVVTAVSFPSPAAHEVPS